MDADRWVRVEQLYHEARALEGVSREAFLSRACGSDRHLLAEIESLLAEDTRPGAFLEEPALAVAARLVSDDIPVMTGRVVGCYRFGELLGAGAMGDVYRARDTVLGRDVAIKVLPEAFSDDPDRLARFEQEAQFLASFSHPNIAGIYGLLPNEGIRGLVLELVDGETLAVRIGRGPIPLSEAVRIARQIGEGLDAAHQRGIVHRDLKPCNIKITRDGTAKILDFGLAKAQAAGSDGLVAGTASYMSPEQVRGDEVDKRADIWAFGRVFVEMLTGRPDPPQWDLVSARAPDRVMALLKRCLEADPKHRRRDIGDVLADLDEALREDGERSRAATSPARTYRPSQTLLVLAIGFAAAAGAFFAGRSARTGAADSRGDELPAWRKLTFADGYVHTARFGPDRQSVLYSASWDGRPIQVFITTLLSPESRALDLPPAGLLAVSRNGELALALSCTYIASRGGCAGTLARAPLLGGGPRVLAENVHSADWRPDNTLAAIVSGRLESPLGTRLADVTGHVRVSPDGQRLATAEREGDSWAVTIRQGQERRVLSRGWTYVSGLAWAPDGNGVFVSGVGPVNYDDAVSRIDLDGTSRLVLRSRPRIRVLDVDVNDRLLIDQSESVTRSWIHDPAGTGRRSDITWLGGSVVDAISSDGRMALLTVRTGSTLEGGRALKPVELFPIYLRSTDGGPATRLGSGYGHALSDDGLWALTSTREDRNSKLVLYPLGPGSPRTLDNDGLDMRPIMSPVTRPSFAKGNRVVFVARRGEGPAETFVQSIDGGLPARVAREPGRVVSPVSPDGERFVSLRPDGSLWMTTLADETATRLPFTLRSNQFIRQWSEDGRKLFVLTVHDDRWIITMVDVRTGAAHPHREIPRERLEDGLFDAHVHISRDGRFIAGTSNRTLSDLYLIEGTR